MNSFPKQQILDICHKYGPQLHVPTGLDGAKVMIAISSNESSIGANCGPRHEPSYDVGGHVYATNARQRALVATYGQDAAMSYGPWQLMFYNFPSGVTPFQANKDLELNAQAFMTQFNNYVIRACKAQTLEEIGEVWNMGHICADKAYTDKLQAAYSLL